MTQDKIKELIKETLKFDERELTETTDLYRDLKIDSLDAVELVMAIEEEYSIEIPDDDVQKLNTIGKIAAYIDEHR